MAQTPFDLYENPVFGFRMEYPKSWSKHENIGGSVVCSFSPDEDPSAQNPCLNVVVQDLSANPTTLDDFTNVSMYQVQQMLPEIDNVRIAERSLSGCQGKHVEYNTTLQGARLKFLQVFTLKDNIAYIITFSAPETSHELHGHLIDKCLQSFRIIERKGVSSLCLAPYYNATYSYQLRYPQSWKKTELQKGAVEKFEFMGKDNKPIITLLVTAERVGENISQEKYTNLMKSQLLECASTKSPPKIESTYLGGFPANKVSFYSDSLQITGRYLQVWTVQNKHAGILTFIHSIAEDDPYQDLYFVMFSRIVESFRFVSSKDTFDSSMRYENIPQKFAIHYPAEYVPQEGFMGATVSFGSPETSNPTFPTNLNIVVQDMGDQPMTLDEFCEMLRQQLEMSVQQCNIAQVTDMTISGGKGREFVYTGKIENQQAGFLAPSMVDLKFVQRVVVKDGKAAVLSFASERDKFQREFDSVGSCLETFTFL